MPYVYTKTEGPTTYRYEPGSSRMADGAKIEQITLSPEPVEVTDDQARVFCVMYEEIAMWEDALESALEVEIKAMENIENAVKDDNQDGGSASGPVETEAISDGPQIIPFTTGLN